MKRFVSLSLCLMMLLSLTVSSWARELVESSTKATKVQYLGLNGNIYPVTPDDAPTLVEWLSDPNLDLSGWLDAKEYKNLLWFEPTVVSPFSDTVAKWISIAANGLGEDSAGNDERGTYVYRQTFKMAATAYNITGSAAIAADNYGWLYLNGNLLVGPRNTNQFDKNFLEPPSSVTSIPVGYLKCDNVLAAEVQNGTSNYPSPQDNSVTGVIFTLKVSYELPQVVWQPPITNTEFALQYGTTVPIKFKLYRGDNLITDIQKVKLAIINESNTATKEWNLGDGVDSLRFDPNECCYIANFQTKNCDNLSDGTYIVKVLDACNGEELCKYISFTVDSVNGTGRGNNPK
jgi:hypothetical protein